jgi:hypothetical protein
MTLALHRCRHRRPLPFAFPHPLSVPPALRPPFLTPQLALAVLLPCLPLPPPTRCLPTLFTAITATLAIGAETTSRTPSADTSASALAVSHLGASLASLIALRDLQEGSWEPVTPRSSSPGEESFLLSRASYSTGLAILLDLPPAAHHLRSLPPSPFAGSLLPSRAGSLLPSAEASPQ